MNGDYRVWYATKDVLSEIKDDLSIESKEGNNVSRKYAVYSKYWGENEVTPKGVCIISVEGILYPFAYKTLGSLIEKAESDESVKKIVLDIDSRGGAVSGLFSVCKTLINCSKPIYTFVDTQMDSAAYAIGACGQKIYATPSADVGSIGALAEYTDYTEMYKKNGIKKFLFKAQHSEKKAVSPTSEEGKAMIQKSLDQAEKFLYEHISSCRNISTEDILEKYGHGEVFYAIDAINRGMVDELVENFDECISKLEDSTEDEDGGGGNLMTLEELKEKHPDLFSKAVEEGKASALAEQEKIKAQAQEEERTRLNEIDNLSTKLGTIKGIPELLAQAKKDGTPIEQLKTKAFDVVCENYKPAVEATEKNSSNNQKILNAVVKATDENTPEVKAEDLEPKDKFSSIEEEAKALAADINKMEVV